MKIKLRIHHLASQCVAHWTWRIFALAASIACYSASAQISPCDLNGDGVVNVTDVQLAVNMAVGAAPCTANIMGAGVCNIVVVQRVVNAALGLGCVTGSGHSATLTWVASTSSNVAGYNVYRGTTSGGPYTLINATPTSALTYVDTTVAAGQTYYYVVESVGTNGSLSAASNEASAVIPSP